VIRHETGFRVTPLDFTMWVRETSWRLARSCSDSESARHGGVIKGPLINSRWENDFQLVQIQETRPIGQWTAPAMIDKIANMHTV
jgi:hypothetical protein